ARRPGRRCAGHGHRRLRDGDRRSRRPSRSARRGRVVTDVLEQPAHVSPLVDRHRALGAKLIEFGGWLMPLQYGGIVAEHRAVRSAAGLFDLSHMGELFIEGPEAGEALAAALVTNPPALAVGRARSEAHTSE